MDIYDKVHHGKENDISSFFLIKKNYDYFSNEKVPYVNNYGKIAGNILNLFYDTTIKELLKSYQLEQINFLKNNPDMIRRELFYSLTTSCLLLNESSRLHEAINTKKTIGGLLLASLKSLSFSGGATKLLNDRINKRREDMMYSVHIAIKLLMNAYYKNKNISKSVADEILSDLVYVPVWDFDELCFYTFSSFMDESIKDFIEKKYDSFTSFAKKYSAEFPSLQTIVDRCNGFYKDRLNELASIESNAYSFYRDKIKEWCTNYPANKNTNNYFLVCDSIREIMGYPSKQIEMDYSLSLLNGNQKKSLMYLLKKNKGFEMPYYYLKIMQNIKELISYWNAFDKNDELEMIL
jgi:hypothetical protein